MARFCSTEWARGLPFGIVKSKKNLDFQTASGTGFTSPGSPGLFPATQWTVIRQVQAEDESMRRVGWEQVCSAYWKPVYVWLRARGAAPEDAEDMAQDFFSRLMEGECLAEVCAEKGRLRSFLLVILKRQSVNAWEYSQAKKRGGGKIMIPLDAQAGEEEWKGLASDGASPDVMFDRQWAVQLLHQVMLDLRETYVKSGQQALFDELRDYISGGSADESYGTAAGRLGMSEGGVKVASFRLRERYRERLRARVLETVSCAEEVNDEIDWLFRVFQ